MNDFTAAFCYVGGGQAEFVPFLSLTCNILSKVKISKALFRGTLRDYTWLSSTEGGRGTPPLRQFAPP